MINRLEIKSEAKQLIRTGRASPLVMTAILLVIGFMLDRVVNLVTYGTLFPEMYDLQAIFSGAESFTETVIQRNTTPSATFLTILVALFLAVLRGGYYSYLMGIRQHWEMGYDSLFDGLSAAGRLIWCEILMGIRIGLWSMLFVIPGLVAAYRYRFAIYNIMADDSLSASEAIALSCKQTRGMKFDLLALDFSFLGWSILSSLTLNILNVWLHPYIGLCDLAYFEEAQRRLGHAPYGGASSYSGDPWQQ